MPHACEPSAAAAALEAEGLYKAFGDLRVVDGVGFRVSPGEIFSLLGPNGAGKTTLVKLLYGSLAPDAGVIRYGGRDFSLCRREAKMSVGVCSQNDTLDYDLDVRENLEVFGSYYRLSRTAARERADELMERFGLAARARHRTRTLSGGLKRRLQIARALVNRPRVLYLDEPTVGLDPHGRRELWDLLHRLREERTAIVLTTHYMDEAESLSDHVVILDRGRVIEEGAPAEMIGRGLGEVVLQLRDTPALEAFLQERGVPFFRGYGRLSVCADGPLVDSLVALLPGEEIVRRRPNLEDLFVKLTGRGL